MSSAKFKLTDLFISLYDIPTWINQGEFLAIGPLIYSSMAINKQSRI